MLVAYTFMRDLSHDGLVRPDELLQHLQAIPLKSPLGENIFEEFILKDLVEDSRTTPCTAGVTHRPGFTLRPSGGDSFQKHPSQPFNWTSSTVAVGGNTGWNSTFDSISNQLPASQFDRPHSTPPAQPTFPSSPGAPMMAALQTAPGLPPVVGYIIPYDQGIFQQLAGDRTSEGGSSGGGRIRPHHRREPRVSAAYESDASYDSEYDDYPPPRVRPSTAPATGAPPYPGYYNADPYSYPSQPPPGYGPYGQGDTYSPFGGQTYPQTPPHFGYQQPSGPWGYPPHHPAGYDGRQGRPVDPGPAYSPADLLIDEALVAGLDDAQQRESARRGRRSSSGSKWRTSMDLPAGQLSVLADGSPYRRSTPYGLLGELQRFIGSRRDAFLNHWMMAAGEAGARGKVTAYVGSEPQINKVWDNV